MKQIAFRTATFNEAMDEGGNLYRVALCAYYTDWDTLINDEKMFDTSPEWMAKLETLKAKFPKFDVKEMQMELNLLS